MASAGEKIRGSQEHGAVDGGALPQAASGTGETSASADAGGRPAQQVIEALRKNQEEIPSMGKAKLLAYEARLRALRLRVLQRIKEEEEKAAEQATAPEPRRAG